MTNLNEKIKKLSLGRVDKWSYETGRELEWVWLWSLRGRQPNENTTMTFKSPQHDPSNTMFIGYREERFPRRYVLHRLLGEALETGEYPDGIEDLVDRVLAGETAESIIGDKRFIEKNCY